MRHVGHMEHISGMIMTSHMSIKAFILYLKALLPLVIIRTSPSSSSSVHKTIETGGIETYELGMTLMHILGKSR